MQCSFSSVSGLRYAHNERLALIGCVTRFHAAGFIHVCEVSFHISTFIIYTHFQYLLFIQTFKI